LHHRATYSGSRIAKMDYCNLYRRLGRPLLKILTGIDFHLLL